MIKGLAYYNHGRWVVDCPADGCTDAREVYSPCTGIRQTEDVCARGHHFLIEMPPPQLEAQIAAVLSERADDADKGWYPRGHARALLAGFPTGQSVAELLAENREVTRFRGQQQEAKQARLRDVLSGLGIEIRPDGSFEGNI